MRRSGASERLLAPASSDETLVLGQQRLERSAATADTSPPRTPMRPRQRMMFESCDESVSVPSMSSSPLGPPQGHLAEAAGGATATKDSPVKKGKPAAKIAKGKPAAKITKAKPATQGKDPKGGNARRNVFKKPAAKQ